jgi:hypothetical protein
MLVCSERKILLAGRWWLICCEIKVLLVCWLVADKPSKQGLVLFTLIAAAYINKPANSIGGRQRKGCG